MTAQPRPYRQSTASRTKQSLKLLRRMFWRRHVREISFSFATIQPSDLPDVVRSIASVLICGERDADREDVHRFENEFAHYLGVEKSFTFASGRMSLRAILQALDVGPGAEVLLPGFTCVVVPAAVTFVGATPRYVDIDLRTFSMDVRDLERHITPSSRAILVQHTFGYPAQMRRIQEIAREHDLLIIEDCAHTIGGTHEGEKLGTLGDAAFFSLELTKPITSCRGGIAVSRHPWVNERLTAVASASVGPRSLDVARVGLEVLVYALLYHPTVFGLGQLPLMLLHKTGVLRMSITEAERRGEAAAVPFSRLSGLQARLASKQLTRIEFINAARQRAVGLYVDRLTPDTEVPQRIPDSQPLLRYPLLVEDRDASAKLFLDHQVQLGEWFNSPLHPRDSVLDRFGYEGGSCPVAEWAANHCANLPTHPRLSHGDLNRITELAKQCVRVPASAANLINKG